MLSKAKSRFCGRVMECWSDVEQSEILAVGGIERSCPPRLFGEIPLLRIAVRLRNRKCWLKPGTACPDFSGGLGIVGYT